MPKIIQDSQQISALHTVSANLDMIVQINALVEDGKKLYVTSGSSSKKGSDKNRPLVAISEKLTGRIISTLETQKAALVREINLLTKKYNIGLSDEEIALLDLTGARTAKNRTEDEDEDEDEDAPWPDAEADEYDDEEYEEEDASNDGAHDNAPFIVPGRSNF